MHEELVLKKSPVHLTMGLHILFYWFGSLFY